MDALLSGQLLVAALVTGALYALTALGLNLVYGTMRLLNVAHGDLVMIGAYVAFWAFTLLALSPLLGLAAAAALAALFGLALYHGLFRRLLAGGKAAQRLEANSLLLFFGVSVIVQNLMALQFTATPRGYQYLDTVYRWGNAAITGNRVAAFAVAVILCGGVLAFLRFHVTGLAIKALIQRRDAAAVVGVNVERVQQLALCLGFASAAVAGALVSMTEQISPFMGFPFTIAAFVVIILGGLGNVTGGIAAGLLLGVLETYGVALTSSAYRSILVYGVFVLILLLRPQGLLGGRRIVR
ncbi:MAG: branched-chain amino acid ABC transporter permease [Candidatus Odyssella sp.]|nr:branched-chain amino acid ABC transporter permease [Candidatus Odyssella sp.]